MRTHTFTVTMNTYGDPPAGLVQDQIEAALEAHFSGIPFGDEEQYDAVSWRVGPGITQGAGLRQALSVILTADPHEVAEADRERARVQLNLILAVQESLDHPGEHEGKIQT